MSGVQHLIVGGDDADMRLDRWFRRHFPAVAHARLEKLLRTGQVRVDGRRAKSAQRLEPGQKVRIPPTATLGDAPAPRVPRVDADMVQELQQRVLFRDDDVLAIDKPAGLAVQGGTNLTTHLDLMLDALAFDAEERPRLVHRLDRDTSGVLVLARTSLAARALSQAFRGRSARKLYWAAVAGKPPAEAGLIDVPLGKQPGAHGEQVGPDAQDKKRAATLFQMIDTAGELVSWLAFMPRTGRTHQIRAHAAALGTPILGDGKYGGREAFLSSTEVPRQLHLHARRLTLPHPRPGKPALDLQAPLPAHMTTTWRFLGFDSADRDANRFIDQDDTE